MLKRWVLGVVSVVAMVASLTLLGAPSAYAEPGGGLPPGITPPGATGQSVSSCAYDNLGWVICPVLRATSQAADYAFTFINQDFAAIEIGLTNQDSGAAKAGAVVRNFANVLFVIVMLVIIYTFVTGTGVSNYNLKRLAPRFIVAVILVQASFYVCQALVDVSNIMGVGIRQILVENVANNIGPSAMPLATQEGEDTGQTLSRLASEIMRKEEIAWPLLAPLTAVVMSIAVITSALIVVMIIRKALVVLLMLLAPIAFVAYLLPNTSEYFSKWLRMFLYTLLLFPVVSLLIGTGQIVSASIIRAGSSSYRVQDDSVSLGNALNQSATMYLVAAGAAVLPLAGTWFAFKLAMNAFDTAGAAVSQRGLRRSARERDEDVKKREQTAMDMNKKSMMMRGVNRLQQLNTVKDGESTVSVFGRVGVYRGRNKHQNKSPEQVRFDNQVQQRLSQLRGGAEGNLSPQELYSQALQRYQDKLGDSSDININSYEGIELKASEAYLLESLSKGLQASGSGAGGEGAGSKDQEKDKSARSSYDKPSQGSGGGGGSGDDSSGAAAPAGKAPKTAGGVDPSALQAAGATVIVQQVQAPGDGSGLKGAGVDTVSGTGFAPRREVQSNNELQAKARAAKYVADAQDAQTLDALEASLGDTSSDTNTTPRE